MPSVGFEPAIPAVVRPLTYAVDRSATEIGKGLSSVPQTMSNIFCLKCYLTTLLVEVIIQRRK